MSLLSDILNLIRQMTGSGQPGLRQMVNRVLKGDRSVRLPPRVEDALNTIQRQLPSDRAWTPPQSKFTPTPQSVEPIPQPGRRTPPPPLPGETAAMPELPIEQRFNTTRARQPQGYPDEQAGFSEPEQMAPDSSNVFSFQFYRRPGDKRGILYVTYKANEITGEMGEARRKGGRRQIRGRRGKTVGSKVNRRGATYAYYDDDGSGRGKLGLAEVYKMLKRNGSKGGTVWDKLRIEGTIYGHRYQYNLVVGQVLKVGGGKLAQYVPRKAGRSGFVTRTVTDIGHGKRGFTSSTLHAPTTGTGYSTKRR